MFQHGFQDPENWVVVMSGSDVPPVGNYKNKIVGMIVGDSVWVWYMTVWKTIYTYHVIIYAFII